MMCCDMAGERNAHQGDVQRFEAEQHVFDWGFFTSQALTGFEACFLTFLGCVSGIQLPVIHISNPQ